MPISPDIKRLWYGYEWQTKIRRDVLKHWGRACVRCHSPWKPLDICHLDGIPANRDISNLVPMCKSCHKKHDYPAWIEKFRIWADGKRPILVFLQRSQEVPIA